MAVLNGASTSSDCFTVGAAVTCCDVSVSHIKKYPCIQVSYKDLAAPLPTIRNCLLTNLFFITFFT